MEQLIAQFDYPWASLRNCYASVKEASFRTVMGSSEAACQDNLCLV